MPALTFSRQFRTISSEVYLLKRDEEDIGHINLHFGSTEVAASLVLFQDPKEEDLIKIIEQIDEDLILSADTPREDLVLTIYIGKEIAFFTDAATRPSSNGES